MLTLSTQTLTLVLATTLIASSQAFRSVGQPRPFIDPKLSRTARPAFALDSAVHAIESFYQTQPYVSAFLTCSVKASAADLAVQTQTWNEEEEEEEQAPVEESNTLNRVDMARNFAYLFHGGIYQGMIQEWFYSKLYPTLFVGDSLETVASTVAFDMLIMGPCFYMTTVYAFKGICAANELSWEAARSGLEKYKEDIFEKGILLKFWSVWVPVQFCTFGLVPMEYRVAFVALVSFFWILLLSAVSSSPDAATEEGS